jgi:hypothetical protein
MQMPGKARVEEAGTAAESYPIIVRSFEPVADLDDRLRPIFTVLSLPPLEELSAQGPCITRSEPDSRSDLDYAFTRLRG